MVLFENVLGKRCKHYAEVVDGWYCWKCMQELESYLKKNGEVLDVKKFDKDLSKEEINECLKEE